MIHAAIHQSLGFYDLQILRSVYLRVVFWPFLAVKLTKIWSVFSKGQRSQYYPSIYEFTIYEDPLVPKPRKNWGIGVYKEIGHFDTSWFILVDFGTT